MSEQQAYFSRAQLLEHLGISDTTLRDWEGRRGFPPPGRNGRWKREKVDAYMDGDESAAVPSSVQRDEIQEIRDAHEAYFASRPRRHVRRRAA